MFGVLTRLSQAFGSLADAVNGVATTLREVDTGLRTRLLLPESPPAPEQLGGPDPAGNGEAEAEAVVPSRRGRGRS